MKIKWIIQDVGIKWSQLNRKTDALRYLGEDMAAIGVIKGSDYISGLEDALVDDLETDYILLSGIKVLNLLKKANSISDVVEFPTNFQLKHSGVILEKLKNAFFYDEKNFDQKVYIKKELPLLNQEAIMLPVKDNLLTKFNEDKFVKPSRDLKAFDPGILEKGQTMEDRLKYIKRQPFYIEEDMVVAPVQKIINEYRFFIVDKEIVGCSSYRRNGRAEESIIVEKIVMEKAKKYAKLYSPHDVFTMDLALMENNKVKIVEYNCFNASGVYLCDLLKTYPAVKKFKLKRGY